MRIEGRTRTLFEGPILTEGHDVSSFKADGGNAAEDLAEHPCDGINSWDPENLLPGPTSTAASVDAMNLIGETQAMAGQWYPGFNDYFVNGMPQFVLIDRQGNVRNIVVGERHVGTLEAEIKKLLAEK